MVRGEGTGLTRGGGVMVVRGFVVTHPPFGKDGAPTFTIFTTFTALGDSEALAGLSGRREMRRSGDPHGERESIAWGFPRL